MKKNIIPLRRESRRYVASVDHEFARIFQRPAASFGTLRSDQAGSLLSAQRLQIRRRRAEDSAEAVRSRRVVHTHQLLLHERDAALRRGVRRHVLAHDIDRVHPPVASAAVETPEHRHKRSRVVPRPRGNLEPDEVSLVLVAAAEREGEQKVASAHKGAPERLSAIQVTVLNAAGESPRVVVIRGARLQPRLSGELARVRLRTKYSRTALRGQHNKLPRAAS
mmetsp:Transcript_21107/g.68274  ORF Transcript_21107/g.68274 Transcript_21107/m.68274 type:complete len:222 (-) Transcript_21107:39-704(-)